MREHSPDARVSPVRQLPRASHVTYRKRAERRMPNFEYMDVPMAAMLMMKNPSVHAKFLHNRHILLLHDDPGSYGNRGRRVFALPMPDRLYARGIALGKSVPEAETGTDPGLCGGNSGNLQITGHFFLLVCCQGRHFFAHHKRLQCVATAKCHLGLSVNFRARQGVITSKNDNHLAFGTNSPHATDDKTY